MEVSFQHPVPTALFHGGKKSVPTEKDAGWAPEPVQTLGEKKTLLPLPEFEPRSDQPAA